MEVPATTSRELRRWIRGLHAQSMTACYSLDDNVEGIYSYDFPDTNEPYVFVGAHHTVMVNTREPTNEKKPPYWRARTLSANLAGFSKNGLHAKVSSLRWSWSVDGVFKVTDAA